MKPRIEIEDCFRIQKLLLDFICYFFESTELVNAHDMHFAVNMRIIGGLKFCRTAECINAAQDAAHRHHITPEFVLARIF